ncbi:MAG: L-2-amino-thiazoline-4-carboxylic acid hydrolase [Draconibacterium sp.]
MKTKKRYLDTQLIEPFLPMLKEMGKAFASSLKIYFDENEIKEILDLARTHFENAKTLLPNVGQQSPWLKNMIGICYEIGLWKELYKRDLLLKDISVLTQHTLWSIALKQNTPAIMEKVGTMLCSQDFVEKIASHSHLEEYPDDWLFDCILPEPTDEFQIGINIHKCPIGSLCERLKADAFFPYLCLNYYVIHGMLGIDLKRTQTLAHGADFCDFRLSYTGKLVPRIITEPEVIVEFRNR